MRRLLCIGLVSALTVSACTGSLFHSNAPPPSTYLLSVKGAAAGALMPTDLTVLTPRVPTGLETDHIAVLYPDRRLDYFAGARWTGPLDEVIQDFALQAFRTYGQFRNVHTDTSAFGAGYWLEIDVVDFQAEYSAATVAPTVHVHFLARIGSSADRRVVAQFEASSTHVAQADRMSAIVDAFNRAADEALTDVVAGTTRALGRAH